MSHAFRRAASVASSTVRNSKRSFFNSAKKRNLTHEEDMYKKFTQELGEETKYMQRVHTKGKAAARYYFMLAVIPLVIFPACVKYYQRKLVADGSAIPDIERERMRRLKAQKKQGETSEHKVEGPGMHSVHEMSFQSNEAKSDKHVVEEVSVPAHKKQKSEKESAKASPVLQATPTHQNVSEATTTTTSHHDQATETSPASSQAQEHFEPVKHHEEVTSQEQEETLEARDEVVESHEEVTPTQAGDIFQVARHYKYVLVGAGTASYHALKAIKKSDPDAEVLIIGNEPYAPYQRPPLTKELWQNEDPSITQKLQFVDWTGKLSNIEYEPKDAFSEESKVTLLTGRTVTDLLIDKKTIQLDDGSLFSYDKCLLATGGNPKTLPGVKSNNAVTTYRTIEDFKALNEARQKAGTIAIVGGGFLGTELAYALATTKADQDTEIVQIFPESGVLSRNLPRYLSTWAAQNLRDAGVKIYAGSGIAKLEATKDNQVKLKLDNGKKIVADHVVVAIGIQPNTQLASQAGLEIDSRNAGIVTNAELEARSSVFVAGDVASYHDIVLGRRRVEHYDHAASSGEAAGLNMTGARKPYTHMSMFWSNIGKDGLEAVGDIDSTHDTVSFWDHAIVLQRGIAWDNKAGQVEAQGKGKKGVVYYLDKDQTVVGVLLWNLHGKLDEAKKIVGERTRVAHASHLVDRIKVE